MWMVIWDSRVLCYRIRSLDDVAHASLSKKSSANTSASYKLYK